MRLDGDVELAGVNTRSPAMSRNVYHHNMGAVLLALRLSARFLKFLSIHILNRFLAGHVGGNSEFAERLLSVLSRNGLVFGLLRKSRMHNPKIKMHLRIIGRVSL